MVEELSKTQPTPWPAHSNLSFYKFYNKRKQYVVTTQRPEIATRYRWGEEIHTYTVHGPCWWETLAEKETLGKESRCGGW